MTEEPAQKKTSSRNSRRMLVWLWSVPLAVIVVSVVVASWHLWPRSQAYYTDADTIRQLAEIARLRDVLWQPPRELSELINTATDDYEPRLSIDGQTLYFVRGKAGENADIHFCRKTLEVWTEAEALARINSDYEDLGPQPSADGRSLFFYSNRPGGSGGYDLWVSYRSDGGWQTPVNLGPRVNSEFNDYGPALSPDGTTLYFASNRPRPEDRSQPNPDGWPATVREDLYQRDYDLYASLLSDRGWGQAQPLTLLNSPFNDGTPAISPVGDFLYFSSDRPPGAGGFDLYRSRVLGGEVAAPESLGGVNSSANELDPGLAMGGFALYFSSDRPIERVEPDKPNDYNLYYTTSREVFREVETRQAQFNWAGLWREILPTLLWALLALLLLLLLIWLLRGDLYRRLSLLAKCFLISALLHAILLFLLTFWQVTARIADFMDRDGRLKVALLSPVAGDDITLQIRGRLADFEAPAPAPSTTEQRQQRLSPHPQEVFAEVEVAVQRPDFSKPILLQARMPAPDLPDLHHDLPDPTSVNRPAEPVTDVALPEDVLVHAGSEPEWNARPQQRELQRAQIAPRERLREIQTPRDVEIPSQRKYNGHLELNPKSLADEIRLPQTAPEWSEAPSPKLTMQATPQPLPALPDLPVSQELRAEESFATQAAADIAARRMTREPELRAANEQPVEVDPPAAHAGQIDSVRTELPPQRMESNVRAALSALPPPPAPAHRLEVPTIPEFETPIPEATDAMVGTPEPSMNATAPAELVAPRHGTRVDLPQDSPTQAVELPPDKTLTEPISIPDAPLSSELTQRFPQSSALASSLSIPPAASAKQFEIPSLPQVQPQTPAPVNAAIQAMERTLDLVPRTPIKTRRFNRDLIPRAPVNPGAVALDPERPALTAEDTTLMALRHADETRTVAQGPLDERMPPATRTLTPELWSIDLNVPAETSTLANPYPQRSQEHREEMVTQMGGSEETEEAVALALDWLAAHQSGDGRWDADDYDDNCGRCSGETQIEADVALTGLALLCFLGADHTHLRQGPYRRHVSRALEWLLSVQEPDGDLRGGETMYSHGIATIAISEAYGMTRDGRLAEPVQAAVDFIFAARSTSVGGWRYDPGQGGDTSVLGWQVMALKSAESAGARVPHEADKVASDWLDQVSRRSSRGLYAYQPGRQFTHAMTAEAMFVQQLLGLPREHPRMRASADYITRFPPSWHSAPNTYFWYYATLALFQHQGQEWEQWNKELTTALLENQHTDGPSAGSWDVTDRWSILGGRVYQTAICTLMLEVYYRYLPMYMRPATK